MLVLKAETFSDVPGIAHGFFGRVGGVSTGIYESLNCGFSRLAGEKDGWGAVVENRRRVLAALGAPQLVTLSQVHSAATVTVTEPWAMADSPQADAMVTATRGIALGILTADCAPVLFADAEAHVIGAAHAGWKGALGGVVEATLAAMEALGARRQHVVAAIGPCISQANYEVGPEFQARFAAEDADHARFFVPSARAEHHRFDLEGFVAARLRRAGVDRIERLSACTYARDADFFSFRRATHRGEKDYGREISAIALI
jgi:hypothetical protein